ncbi:uncharacterized protein [Diadema antillarum]|uniref:uncharacterized protein n=1 Tax=Diadema antillarum TaxID=105358 RepID=UPI003A88176D
MNSTILVVMGLILLTAELIPAVPAPFFDDNEGLALQDLGLEDEMEAVKRNSLVQQRKCVMQCFVCSSNTSMKMMECANGCKSSGASASQTRAYMACNSYLHSGRK